MPTNALPVITNFLEKYGIRYFVIGGIANAIWGDNRFTLDVDLKVLVDDFSPAELVTLLEQAFTCRVSNPHEFVQKTFVIPIETEQKIPVDIILALLPYEEQAFEHAKMVTYLDVTFRVCSAEDLIIQKSISKRAKDWDDIRGILIRQGDRLNHTYILDWLRQFDAMLETETVKHYQEQCQHF
ncbi:MAG: hypothetical protein B6242_00975 [Anaerolineaceae bacterium 4572_78]|nr:MAG: hypothetical protein B6242_00975 [Anaerolineaceae bacterium 4572_78]